jgi:DNA-binding response OmpR family regulator
MMDRKIVLVDDDKVTLRFLEHFLVDNLFSVQTAQDGETALELVKREKPSILISDLVLPKIDGAELCKRIKQDEGLKRTKVILMSATYMGSTLRLAARDSGADGFVCKPIRATDLLERIYKLSAEAESPADKEKPSQ